MPPAPPPIPAKPARRPSAVRPPSSVLRRPSPAHPRSARVHAYARAVVAGEIVAGRLVRLACQRHLDDLRRSGFDEFGRPLPSFAKASEGTPAPSSPLVWRPEMAEAFLVFAGDCVNLEVGKPLVLDDWQIFVAGSLFGWYGIDGYRRYHTAYIEIGKGNGKTPFAAVIALYGLLVDKEHAPEIYSAAVAQEQAAICFKHALMMIDCSPELKKRVQVQVGSVTVPARFGVFRALSAEHKTLDGKIVHIGIVDELHEHPNDLVVDKLDAGTKQRRNALILEITNAGVGRESVCWRHHETSAAILEQRGPGNDAWFAYVCGLDPCPACHAAGKSQPDPNCPHCDDWRDPKTWIKANPSIDVILPGSYLARLVTGARAMVSKENIVRRLNFCQWTEQANRWLSMVAWDQCAGPLAFHALAASLHGRKCKLGLDAATVSDFSAAALLFHEGGKYPVLPFFFIPEDTLGERVRKTGLRFDLWRDQGLLETTPGNQTDYAWIEKKILALRELYEIEEIAYDPWNITDLIARLIGHGFNCVPVRQGFQTLSPPCKEFERDILGRRLVHAGHPILRWMAGNVTTLEDPAGNIKYDKEKSTEKIDGIAATIIARDRWLRKEPVEAGEPGILFF